MPFPFIVSRSASAAMSKADRDRLADEVMNETMRLLAAEKAAEGGTGR